MEGSQMFGGGIQFFHGSSLSFLAIIFHCVPASQSARKQGSWERGEIGHDMTWQNRNLKYILE